MLEVFVGEFGSWCVRVDGGLLDCYAECVHEGHVDGGGEYGVPVVRECVGHTVPVDDVVEEEVDDVGGGGGGGEGLCHQVPCGELGAGDDCCVGDVPVRGDGEYVIGEGGDSIRRWVRW